MQLPSAQMQLMQGLACPHRHVGSSIHALQNFDAALNEPCESLQKAGSMPESVWRKHLARRHESDVSLGGCPPSHFTRKP